MLMFVVEWSIIRPVETLRRFESVERSSMIMAVGSPKLLYRKGPLARQIQSTHSLTL